jgi:Uma2 family endonuclease
MAEYFRAGVRLVWLIYPETRQVHAFVDDGDAHTYDRGDTVAVKPVLPDVYIHVNDLFPEQEA